MHEYKERSPYSMSRLKEMSGFDNRVQESVQAAIASVIAIREGDHSVDS